MKFHLSIWNSTQVIGFWKIQSRKSTTSGYRKSLKSWYGSTILIKYLYMKFHQPSCNGTQVIVFTHRQTHIHTDRIAKSSFYDSITHKTPKRLYICIYNFCLIKISHLYSGCDEGLRSKTVKTVKISFFFFARLQDFLYTSYIRESKNVL